MAVSPADLANAIFEVAAAAFGLMHVARAWRDRVIRGVHPLPFVFFGAWGAFNLWFYASLGQPLSAAAAVTPILSNVSFLLSWWLLQPPRMSFQPSERFSPVEAYAYVPANLIEAARLWLRQTVERVINR